MPPRGDEPELVQPPAHLDCVVAVQVEELDTVVADLPHRPEHAFEIARAVVANRVQLQRDAGHRRLATGAGRLLSIAKVGLPRPAAVWLGYLIPELVIPFIMAGAHHAGR